MFCRQLFGRFDVKLYGNYYYEKVKALNLKGRPYHDVKLEDRALMRMVSNRKVNFSGEEEKPMDDDHEPGLMAKTLEMVGKPPSLMVRTSDPDDHNNVDVELGEDDQNTSGAAVDLSRPLPPRLLRQASQLVANAGEDAYYDYVERDLKWFRRLTCGLIVATSWTDKHLYQDVLVAAIRAQALAEATKTNLVSAVQTPRSRKSNATDDVDGQSPVTPVASKSGDAVEVDVVDNTSHDTPISTHDIAVEEATPATLVSEP